MHRILLVKTNLMQFTRFGGKETRVGGITMFYTKRDIDVCAIAFWGGSCSFLSFEHDRSKPEKHNAAKINFFMIFI